MAWITVATRFAAALLAFDTALLDPPGDVHASYHTPPLFICSFHGDIVSIIYQFLLPMPDAAVSVSVAAAADTSAAAGIIAVDDASSATLPRRRFPSSR